MTKLKVKNVLAHASVIIVGLLLKRLLIPAGKDNVVWQNNAAANDEHGGSSATAPGETSASSTTTTPHTSSWTYSRATAPGRLHPSDLAEPVSFSAFDGANTTIELPGGITKTVASGHVTQINNVGDRASIDAEFAVLEQAVDHDSIELVLQLLRSYKTYDEDPDTVDGMPTYEMFVDNPDLRTGTPGMKVLDSDPNALPQRTELRKHIRRILDPYLNNVLTPFVRARYPEACNTTADRACTPCYSLIRRYRHGERQSHATHHDGHAIVTVVVSLSDYGKDYRGGLCKFLLIKEEDEEILCIAALLC